MQYEEKDELNDEENDWGYENDEDDKGNYEDYDELICEENDGVGEELEVDKDKNDNGKVSADNGDDANNENGDWDDYNLEVLKWGRVKARMRKRVPVWKLVWAVQEANRKREQHDVAKKFAKKIS